MNNGFDMNNNFDQYSQFEAPPEQGGGEKKRLYAADYRREARAALSNRMGVTICANLLAGMLTYAPVVFAYFFMIFSAIFFANEDYADSAVFPIILVSVLLVMVVVMMILGAAISVGQTKLYLGLVRKDPSVGIGTVFSGFGSGCWGKMIGLVLLLAAMVIVVYIPLIAIFASYIILSDTLLPFQSAILMLIMNILYWGIVVGMAALVYQYRLSIYLLVDHPEMGVFELLRTSRQMMKGNKWRMFCLDFSFIGWFLLATYCSCGIGMLVLTPYIGTADAAFYNDLAGFPAGTPDTENTPPQPPVAPATGSDDYFPGAF